MPRLYAWRQMITNNQVLIPSILTVPYSHQIYPTIPLYLRNWKNRCPKQLFALSSFLHFVWVDTFITTLKMAQI